MAKMSGGHALMRCLVEEGVDTIFGYPGGAIMPVYNALYDFRDQINHILVRHEQAAAHAAEGYARMSGKPGVCIATSGPGATNLVTGIADAMMDSIPLVCITGQVSSAVLGTDAFQETDVIGVTIPITKWNYQITDASEIPEIMAKAFYIARSGRPGPVLVDITKNAQIESVDFNYQRREDLQSYSPKYVPEISDLDAAATLINQAERPLLLVGHGVLISKAEERLLKFVEKSGIPVACTLHGLSAFPTRHPLYAGMLGMHGNYGPNVLSNQADLVIACGMRFDDRVTGDLGSYLKKAKVIHIEIDPAEIHKNVRADVAIVADAGNALAELLPRVEKRTHPEWIEKFQECARIEFEKIIGPGTQPSDDKLRMIEVIHQLSERSKGDAVVVANVGQHQMMSARYYRFNTPDSWVTSGGLGTMGFALPAAIGCKFAVPNRQVVAVIGDGCFQMTLQELATIAQEDLPVKIMVLNNNFLGMVRQWQELFFDNRYSFVNLKNPNFVKVVEGFGIQAEKVSTRAELGAAIDRMLAAPKAYFLEVVVEMEENVFPMVPTGTSVSDIRLE